MNLLRRLRKYKCVSHVAARHILDTMFALINTSGFTL